MSGRPAGPGSQAERVVRLYRALTGATPVWFKQLALDLGRSERTIRRDLEVVGRAVAPGHVVEHAADGQVRLVAIGSAR